MTNPYPQYTQDDDFPWREYENPLYVAWEQGYNVHKQEVERDTLVESKERGMWFARPDGAGGG